MLNITPPYFTPCILKAPIGENWPAILYDFASEPARNVAIQTSMSLQSAAVTDILQLLQDSTGARASGIVMTPLYPTASNISNSTLPLGFGTATFSWDEILHNVVAIREDIWIRLSSSPQNTVFSFRKQRNENISNLGFFDNFSSLLTPYLRSKSKTFSLSGGGDQKFHITIFPSIDLYDRYHTSTPLKVMLIVVFIVVAFILLFGSYDFLVRGFSRILNRVTQKMQGPTSLTLSFVKLAVSVYGTRDIKSIIFPNEIERDDITQLDVLGKGAFGIVYKGLLRVLDSPSFLVALKTIELDISAENIKEVMCEALLMNQLRHDHVCRLVGICPSSSSAPMLMIIQYCEFGSLDDVFKKYDNRGSSFFMLPNF